ncbi:regulatory protein Crp [Planctopirus limnophila DSM 3776]|uniref:Regulatory protein Crp n=1 Tax=Planctopirus limnophila (strain ATCC 43296 / DSM 3776 / IFAM 1008 / Mu 290) TaxID=521674 RepID=D5STP9_PLAL2|nr:regulatory protein Crp [Planctopirus limnophila DSM 3776]
MWIRVLAADELIRICSNCPSARQREFKTKSVIYLSQPRETVWIVREGFVKLTLTRDTGDRWMQAIVGRGGLFGAPLFHQDRSPSSATGELAQQATAHGRIKLIELDRSFVEQGIRIESHRSAAIIESFTSQIRILERRLLWQNTSPLRARIATILCDLVTKECHQPSQDCAVSVPLTHQELADLSRATRPVVSKILAEWKQQQIISYTRQDIRVSDYRRLFEIAGEITPR